MQDTWIPSHPAGSLPVDSWTTTCYWHQVINQVSFSWNGAEQRPSASQILLANLTRASNDTQTQVASHCWRFWSEHFVQSLPEALYKQGTAASRILAAASHIRYPPGAEVASIWAGTTQTTSLRCCRSCGKTRHPLLGKHSPCLPVLSDSADIHLPRPCRQMKGRGAALGGRAGRGEQGCPAAFLEKNTRCGEFSVLKHQDSSLHARTGVTAKTLGANPRQIQVNPAQERTCTVSNNMFLQSPAPCSLLPFPLGDPVSFRLLPAGHGRFSVSTTTRACPFSSVTAVKLAPL